MVPDDAIPDHAPALGGRHRFAPGTQVFELTPGDDLAAVLLRAPPGAHLVLGPGDYRLDNTVRLAEALTLRGAGRERTTIVSTSEACILRYAGTGLLDCEDLTFRHEGRAWADGIVAVCGQVRFVNCRVTGARTRMHFPLMHVLRDMRYRGGRGLHLAEVATGEISNSEFTGNDASGLELTDGASAEIVGNTCNANGDAGILFRDHAGGTARDNTCERNGFDGLAVANFAAPLVVGNRLAGNSLAGLAYEDAASGEARENTCEQNGINGVRVTLDARPTLIANRCQRNGESGITCHGSAQATLTGNRCMENDLHGITIAGHAIAHLADNVGSGNRRFGLFLTDTAIVHERDGRYAGNQEGDVWQGKAARLLPAVDGAAGPGDPEPVTRAAEVADAWRDDEAPWEPDDEMLRAIALDVPALALAIGPGTFDPVELADRLVPVRLALATDLGLVLPPVSLAVDDDLDFNAYAIRLHGTPVAAGSCPPGDLLAVPPLGEVPPADLAPGPVFGARAMAWAPLSREAGLAAAGWELLDGASVPVAHLEAIARAHAASLLSLEEVLAMVAALRVRVPRTADAVVRAGIAPTTVWRVLQRLLAEGVSIRELGRILENMAEGGPRPVDALVVAARRALGRAIVHPLADAEGRVAVTAVAGPPGDPAELVAMVAACDACRRSGRRPVLVAPVATRAAVFAALAPDVPDLVVLCRDEIPRPYTLQEP